MVRLLVSPPAFGLGLALAACGAVPATSLGEYHSYTIHEFAFAAGGRDLRTVVVGNPFPVGKTEFDSRVVALMQGKNAGPVTRFTTTPNESAHPLYRVVLLFNGPDTLIPSALCRVPGVEGEEAPVAEGGGIRVLAAFCRGDKTLSGTRGWLAGAAQPGDPGFGELIGQVTRTLFPPRDPSRGGRRRHV